MRVVGFIGTLVLAVPCMGQMFQGLGIVPGRSASRANAIASDGSTVIGGSGPTPWRWTNAGGLQPLGPAPSGLNLTPASDVSGDGAVVVGAMNDGNLTYAWRWTQSTGIQRVVGVGGGASFGPFVSSDGSTIVGTGEGLSIGPAVRWTQLTGAQSLNPVTGVPIGQGNAIIANGVSADGSVVVGAASAIYITFPQTITTGVPFRWTQATGSVGMLNNGQFYFPEIGAGASDVSADGSVVVGYVGSSAWRWTSTTGFQLVSNSQLGINVLPRVSGDGNTVVNVDFVWTEQSGELPLATALTQAGCNITGWNNFRVTDVSFDGRSLCGYGTNPTGQTEAWYATIPAPSVGGMVAWCCALIARRRR